MKYFNLKFISAIEYKYHNSIKEIYYSDSITDRHDEIYLNKKHINKVCIAYNHEYVSYKNATYVNFYMNGVFDNNSKGAHYTYSNCRLFKDFYLKRNIFVGFKSNKEWRKHCKLLMFL